MKYFLLLAIACMFSVLGVAQTATDTTYVEILYLAEWVKNGKLRFKEVDISTPEGEKLAEKYRVSWSSLFVNQWENGKEKRNDMTRFGFQNARNNTAAFKKELQQKITQLLK